MVGNGAEGGNGNSNTSGGETATMEGSSDAVIDGDNLVDENGNACDTRKRYSASSGGGGYEGGDRMPTVNPVYYWGAKKTLDHHEYPRIPPEYPGPKLGTVQEVQYPVPTYQWVSSGTNYSRHPCSGTPSSKIKTQSQRRTPALLGRPKTN